MLEVGRIRILERHSCGRFAVRGPCTELMGDRSYSINTEKIVFMGQSKHDVMWFMHLNLKSGRIKQ